MATWVTHLIIADRVLKSVPGLVRHEFCVGNIAPDCNVENADWTAFTPPREITHWMTGPQKRAEDSERFLREYMKKRQIVSAQEESFLWGYYAHLVSDGEFQRFIRDEARVRASWARIKAHCILREKAMGMPETWDSVKILIDGKERMKDIHAIEKDYLDAHPDSGYLTEILGLSAFPDYMDFLPPGAIPRKIAVMGYLPEKISSQYPYIGISKEEYSAFLDRAADLVQRGIKQHRKNPRR